LALSRSPGNNRDRNGALGIGMLCISRQLARRRVSLLDRSRNEIPVSTRTQERVFRLLRPRPQDGPQAAGQLFWTELNYGNANE
jgi:hypothetical protein